MSNPIGQYTDVNVHPIQHQNGSLSPPSTGTYNADLKTFSCGDFDGNDRPEVDTRYNINGRHNGTRYDFPGVKCTHSGKTSDFEVS